MSAGATATYIQPGGIVLVSIKEVLINVRDLRCVFSGVRVDLSDSKQIPLCDGQEMAIGINL